MCPYVLRTRKSGRASIAMVRPERFRRVHTSEEPSQGFDTAVSISSSACDRRVPGISERFSAEPCFSVSTTTQRSLIRRHILCLGAWAGPPLILKHHCDMPFSRSEPGEYPL
jgi:hypothetical protein